MARVSKDPEVRKNEILEVARSLFIELGYKKTSIERIIDKLNIAKGTFYYYFKSKADLLEAIADQHAEAHYQNWKAIIERDDLNAIQKLNLIFSNSLNLKLNSKDLLITYLNAMIDEQNIMFRYKLGEKRNRIAADYLGKIVEQGNQEGVFDTPYPYGSILMILKLSESM
ncbi:MAG: TetR/AcrR family transcriptional regulator, partial [Bacteroidota bacterium]